MVEEGMGKTMSKGKGIEKRDCVGASRLASVVVTVYGVLRRLTADQKCTLMRSTRHPEIDPCKVVAHRRKARRWGLSPSEESIDHVPSAIVLIDIRTPYMDVLLERLDLFLLPYHQSLCTSSPLLEHL